MHKDRYVFAQLVSFLNDDKFRHIVDNHEGNKVYQVVHVLEPAARSHVRSVIRKGEFTRRNRRGGSPPG